MKIGLLTLCIGKEYKKAVELGIDSKKIYCTKHGYDFIIGENDVHDISRPIAWSKIKMIEKYISKYDYIFCSDADVIIMNNNIKIEDLITTYMTSTILLVTRDWNNINTGNIIIKNDYRIPLLLKDIYSQTQYINHPWWEQMGFIHLYNNRSDIRNYTCVLTDSHVINAYVCQFKGYILPDNNIYRTGDLLIHLAGIDALLDLHEIFKICLDIKKKECINGFNNKVIIDL